MDDTYTPQKKSRLLDNMSPQTPSRSIERRPLNLLYRSKTFNPHTTGVMSTDRRDGVKLIEYVEAATVPPVNGTLTVEVVFTHVYIAFCQEVVSTLGSPMKVHDTVAFKFCVEDTPSFSMKNYEITFHPGRELTSRIYPIMFNKDSLTKFVDILTKMNITMENGLVRYEKKRMPVVFDITKYMGQLKFDNQLIKRNNWIKQIKADYTETVTRNTTWNIMSDRRVRKGLFYRGVDDDFRGEAWTKCLGVDITKDDYEKITQQIPLLLPGQITNNKKLAVAFKQLGKDITRTYISTYCSERWGGDTKEIKKVIERLMKCWILYNQDGGYQQGMSDLLVGIMEYSKEEHVVFGLFVKIIEMMSTVFFDAEHFDRYIYPIIKSLDKELYGYFKMLQIGYSFMSKWVVVLFRRDFSHDKCARIWDAIFAFPENKLHYFIAACMLEQHRDVILSTRFDLDDISIFFQSLEGKFDDNVFIDADIASSNFRMDASDNDQILVFS
ncbi:hypothetical protein EIN_153140 [Entamoeba invadens IP1]|uniref:Rab-GAP TBC domain-containing protein n=1 Tax=Entamoeba invadens IP1 TaxID=370355 RepID=A0A0A1U8Y0_ENTIV|nr:hypothetical protein EIN_153140 [Entamoeba invadens IP1]ELP91307.1 hypothetical protein EIN_153140 [Entamoeba invadens IP1]|eukprot:XP_004258078.1 hypothetical protein EIN_153140 [Entamoeba invadens IP1]